MINYCRNRREIEHLETGEGSYEPLSRTFNRICMDFVKTITVCSSPNRHLYEERSHGCAKCQPSVYTVGRKRKLMNVSESVAESVDTRRNLRRPLSRPFIPTIWDGHFHKCRVHIIATPTRRIRSVSMRITGVLKHLICRIG